MKLILPFLIVFTLSTVLYSQTVINNPKIDANPDSKNLSIVKIEFLESKVKVIFRYKFKKGEVINHVRIEDGVCMNAPGKKRSLKIYDDDGNKIADLIETQNIAECGFLKYTRGRQGSTIDFIAIFTPITSLNTNKISIIEGEPKGNKHDWLSFYGVDVSGIRRQLASGEITTPIGVTNPKPNNPTILSAQNNKQQDNLNIQIGNKDSFVHINQWVKVEGYYSTFDFKNDAQILVFVESFDNTMIQVDTITKKTSSDAKDKFITYFKLLKNPLASSKLKFNVKIVGKTTNTVKTIPIEINYSEQSFKSYPIKYDENNLIGLWISYYKQKGKNTFFRFLKDKTVEIYTYNDNLKYTCKVKWSIENRFGTDQICLFNVPMECKYLSGFMGSLFLYDISETETIWVGGITCKIDPIMDDTKPLIKKLNQLIIGKWANSDNTFLLELKANHTLIEWGVNTHTVTGSWYWETKLDDKNELLYYLIFINDNNISGVEKYLVDLNRLSQTTYYAKRTYDVWNKTDKNQYWPMYRNDDIIIPIEHVNMSPDQILGPQLLGLGIILGTAISGGESSNGDSNRCKCMECKGNKKRLYSDGYYGECNACHGTGGCN